ncbi:MAG TPA: GNAT family N-acetyltransferase [Bacteroidia bacterium]|nr:GNAT family N-acetyltransferase [Bacteroidia bacterium]
MNIVRTTSDDKDFRQLIAELDKYLAVVDGPGMHEYYDKHNKVEKNNTVVVAYIDNKPVGCGCFKEYDKDSVEMKRMYVKEEARGKKIGFAILQGLEIWATEIGYSNSVLETGLRQVEAVSLYKKSGYAVIKNYGPYIGIENSICFLKKIK